MGRHSQRKREFLTRNPICCFCGGQTPAETEDHLPARSLFLNRRWPEGYVFPACRACNAGSSDDELVMAALVRLGVMADLTAEGEADLERVLSGLRFRLPQVYQSLREVSRIETRRFLRDRGVRGTTLPGIGEVYMVTVPATVIDVTQRYAEKLGKALHYLHAGKILPSTGKVVTHAFTNADLLNSNMPEKFFALLGGVPVLRRDVTPLADQFRYRFGVVGDGEASGYWIQFRGSMAMLVAVFLDEAEFQRRKAERAGGTAFTEMV